LEIVVANAVGEVADVEFVAHGERLSFLKRQRTNVELLPILNHSSEGAASIPGNSIIK
jgi:hypothetical protein